MFVSLLAVALTAQAAEEVWQVKCPLGHPINVRGHRDGDWFRAAFPVAKGIPPASRTINFGLDMPHMPKTSSIRGTDGDLGRELAGTLIGQRPCPGPGPCPAPPRPPAPPRLPDPVVPDPPPPNLALIGIAIVFVLMAFFMLGLFLLLLVLGRRRP